MFVARFIVGVLDAGREEHADARPSRGRNGARGYIGPPLEQVRTRAQCTPIPTASPTAAAIAAVTGQLTRRSSTAVTDARGTATRFRLAVQPTTLSPSSRAARASTVSRAPRRTRRTSAGCAARSPAAGIGAVRGSQS